MVLGNRSAIPTDIKADVARVAQSAVFEGLTGGDCRIRVAMGYKVCVILDGVLRSNSVEFYIALVHIRAVMLSPTVALATAGACMRRTSSSVMYGSRSTTRHRLLLW